MIHKDHSESGIHEPELGDGVRVQRYNNTALWGEISAIHGKKFRIEYSRETDHEKTFDLSQLTYDYGWEVS